MLLEELGDELLRRQTLLGGVQLDRRAVRVVGAEIDDILAERAQEADIDVRLHIFDEMAEVNRAIRIGERAGDQQSFGHQWGTLTGARPVRNRSQAAIRRQTVHSKRSSTNLPFPEDLSARAVSAQATRAAKSSLRS